MSRKHALQIFRAALAAADPEAAVLRHLQFDGRTIVAGRRRYSVKQFDRIQVIGAGKAGAAMARGVERVLGRRIASGWINVKDGHRAPAHTAKTRRVHLHECGHPVPDERGVAGSHELLEIAGAATERDLLICVLSGGASALLPAPATPLTLAAKQEITRRLLASGATIHEMNAVRKHLSRTFRGSRAGGSRRRRFRRR